MADGPPRPLPSTAPPPMPGTRVVLADALPARRAALARLLEDAGLEVEAVADGDAAFAAARAASPDLFLAPRTMPMREGPDLLAAVHAHAALREIPFLVLDDAWSAERRAAALAEGATDAMPFVPEALVERALVLLDGASERRLIALRDSEARYRTLFDSIDEGFCVIEFVDGPHGPLSDYVHVEANPAYLVNAGIANVVGRYVREMVPDEADDWVARYRQVLLSGETIRFERTLEATSRVLELFAFRVGPVAKRQVGVLFRDVTANRRAQAELEQRVAAALAERRILADIIGSTDAFVQVADHDFRWLAVNAAAADEFERGFGVRPVVGQSMLEALADQPEHQAAVRAVWARALAGEQFTEIHEFGDPGRHRAFYEMKFNVLRDGGGRAIGAYQFASDVTERIRDRERLMQAEEALRQAQKMEAVGQLTGGVAHDFNNLLTVIKSSTELLQRPGLPEARRERYIDAIAETVDRAAKLTGQLLAFARRQALRPETFDPAERLHRVSEMLRTVVGQRVRVSIDIAAEPCLIYADASQFETALVNMAANARDAMAGEGALDVRLAPVDGLPAIRGHGGGTGRYVALSIADTGAGIAPDQLAQIFEPFFTTKEVGKGTGLGLSQVYGFAKQSGGDVAVESAPGAGATFTLFLPRAIGELVATPAAPAAPTAAGGGQRVLVVEDNVEVGTFTTHLLQDMGFETVWAANAGEALALLERGDGFDAVFSDVVMPGMNGIELGLEIRRRFPTLPVVLASGYSQELAEDGTHGFPLLNKPYAAHELVRTLRAQMQRAAAAG